MHRFGLLGLLIAVPAWASHPLITEDTNVLGRGGWELELHGERARDDDAAGTRRSDILAKLGYGIADNADVEVELPYVRETADGVVREGRVGTSLSVKWRFHDKDGFSLAIKPALLLPTGRDEVELGAAKLRWAANLAGGYSKGKLDFLANLGYADNRNDSGERRSLWHASAAVLYSLADKLRLLADYSRDSQPDPAAGSQARVLVVGATYALSGHLTLGLGLKKGLNDAAEDRALRAGVKLRW